MDDTSRNTRTLIVSFVLAVMVLIPLRFVEVGQVSSSNSSQVLGETTVNRETVATPTAALEEPYQTIESQKHNCVSRSDLDAEWEKLKTDVEDNKIDKDQTLNAASMFISMEKSVCN
jgi:hypothetical protein